MVSHVAYGWYVFDDAQLAEFEEITADFATALQNLRASEHVRGRLMWQIKPKAHKMCHIPAFAALLSPRAVSCYADESHIGTCCAVWRKSVNGRYQDHVELNVLTKRVLGVLVRSPGTAPSFLARSQL